MGKVADTSKAAETRFGIRSNAEDMHCCVQAKGGITSDILEAMTAEHKTLSSRRKKRQISETIATPDEVSSMNLAGSFPIHKTTQVRSFLFTRFNLENVQLRHQLNLHGD